MAEITVSTMDHPVVLIIFPTRIELSDMDELGRKMELVYSKAHAKQQPLVVVVDTSQLTVGGMAPEARIKLAKLGDESLRRYPGVRIAEAVVSHSPTVRAVLKAHNLFRRAKVQQGVFPDLKAAKAWAHTLLQEASVPKTGS